MDHLIRHEEIRGTETKFVEAELLDHSAHLWAPVEGKRIAADKKELNFPLAAQVSPGGRKLPWQVVD